MQADLERYDFIILLDRMKSTDDTEILAAVRDINAKMTVANVTWDDLLTSQNDISIENNDDEVVSSNNDGQTNDYVSQSLSAEEKKEAAKLISTIASMKISKATKQELEEYTADLNGGEFEQMDLLYLRALQVRLSP
jgi:hypothetical protein